MSTPVTLPALGESVTEGTVTRWLKQPGDTVEVDEPLLEVSTDKVDTEIPSPIAGTLLEIKAAEDETVEVGAELCTIGDSSETGGSGGSGGTADDAEPDADTPQDAPASSAADRDDRQDRDSDLDEGESPATPSGDDPEPQRSEPASTPSASTAAPSGGDEGTDDGTTVTLPELGESVTEGTVTRWLKQPGDTVEVDEPLLEVSTDKVDTEIPSPIAGTLLEIKAAEDETVEVGADLAVIGSGTPRQSAPAPAPQQPAREAAQPAAPEPEQPREPARPPQRSEPEPQQSAQEPGPRAGAEPAPARPAQQQPAQQQPAQQDGRSRQQGGDSPAYVTPLVRKMAAEHGVDLAGVTGSGVGGRIRKQDVLAAAEQKRAPAAVPGAAEAGEAAPATTPSPLRGQTEPMSRLRKVIASRMVESLRVSAQLTQVIEVDLTNIARLRDSVKDEFLAREGVKLSYLPFFAKAAVDALKQHPKLNANIDTEKGEVTYFDRENIAFAVDTEKGLLTPVVKEAGDLSVSGLAKKIADVAERSRTNKIGPDDLTGGTFTITNLGSVGALFDTPIINQPQVAILGPGTVTKRPVVIDDPNLGETIAVRHMAFLSLSYDHRLIDGADAGRFLADVRQRLESGQFEV